MTTYSLPLRSFIAGCESSFLEDSAAILNNINSLLKCSRLNPAAAHHMHFLVEHSCELIDSSSLSFLPIDKLVVHRWNENEVKAFALSNNHSPDLNIRFWLKYYPFVDSFKSTSSTINSLLSPSIRLSPLNHFPFSSHQYDLEYSLLSHNNHFGHFLADDLPRWIYLTSLNPNVVPLGYSIKSSHLDVLSELRLISPSSRRFVADLSSSINVPINQSVLFSLNSCTDIQLPHLPFRR